MKKILIVEDDSVSAQLCKSILGRQFEVVLVSTANQALDVLAGKNPFDLILLDIGLPDMDGYALCQAVREKKLAEGVPIIFITGRTASEDEEQGFRVGAVDYIRKPLSPYVLRARVNARLGEFGLLDAEASEQGDKRVRMRERLSEFEKSFSTAQGDGKSSRLYIINLTPLEKLFASRWEKVQHKVVFIVETMVSSSLGKGEAYKYFGDNIFAVIYPSLGPAEGKVRAGALCENICKKLLGEEFEAGRGGQAIVDEMQLLGREAETPAGGGTQTGGQDPQIAYRHILDSVQMEYLPIWNPEFRHVDGYRVSFRREFHGRSLFGKSVLQGGGTDPLWPGLYEKMFADITGKLNDVQGKTPYVIVTIHTDSLMNREFLDVIKIAATSGSFRKRIRIEIVGLDDDISMNRLYGILSAIGSFCDSLMVRISPDSPISHEIKMLGVNTIGLNFSDVHRSGLGRRASYVVASHFAKKSASLGFNNYVWDVDTIPDFQVMMATHFKSIGGKVIGPSVEAPAGVRPLAQANILKPVA
jgi:DNA-binding response OmpR family regulator